MKVILTGGGTGGHIYPAIAIGNKIKEKMPNAEFLYLGFERGLEATIVPNNGYDIKFVKSRWVVRGSIIGLIKTGYVVMQGKRESLKIMKEFKPDIVIGTGGYVSFPVILAGHKYGSKIYIHEQNAYPGMANQKLSKYVDKIFLGFDAARKYFSNIMDEKIIYSGNPVRETFYGITKESARETLNIAKDDFVIFSFGGSQGAKAINETMIEIIKKFGEMDKIKLIFGTGAMYYDGIVEKFEETDKVTIKDYIEDMPNYLGASDLIIGRAGALSLAEITICGRASILIPSPNVTGNHQYFNAKSVADKGGAIIVNEDENMIDNVISIIGDLIEDKDKLDKMEKGSINAAMPSATDIIFKEIFSGEKI
ncbi:MAG: undecaprenyldiphospho-muramoylpentapeptide beta-N-acetylglucosaminyltransferase [Peptostreptococcaceae bacterium]|nr:undecaprenyldiphospho-muramoylpentapeptide beta-N-acetylglucosaminyltransferase [Peptostreptococcaceae bacterium]